MKLVLLSISILTSSLLPFQAARAAYLQCPKGQSYTAFTAKKEGGCRSGVALYFNDSGRCLTQDSKFRPTKEGLYSACLQLYPGMVAGSYVASIESTLDGQDGKITYE